MDKSNLVRVCDNCGKENSLEVRICSCGNNLELICPTPATNKHKKYRKCIVCGQENYIENGKDVRKCSRCGNNELYKSKIEELKESEEEETEAITISKPEEEEKYIPAIPVLKLKMKNSSAVIPVHTDSILGRLGDVGAKELTNYPYVGRFHCELNFKNGEWYVKDLDSRGGTRINGSLIDKETVLKQGDLLSIANAHFEVILR